MVFVFYHNHKENIGTIGIKVNRGWNKVKKQLLFFCLRGKHNHNMSKPKITKAVIPVAGLGTRLLPATISQPKEMLPIVDKPVIQYVIEEAVDSGISDILMITGKSKRAIEDYFDANQDLLSFLKKRNKDEFYREVLKVSNLGNFFYIRQEQPPRGLGHAVLQAEKHIGNEYFAVLLGDTIVNQKDPCTGKMMALFEKYRLPVIALAEVPKHRVCDFGIAKISINRKNGTEEIVEIVEKPKVKDAPSNLSVAARYILPPEIFSILKKTKPRSGEIQLTDAIATYIKRGGRFLAYQVKGEKWDIGSKLEYAKAFASFALTHSKIKDEFRKFLKQLV